MNLVINVLTIAIRLGIIHKYHYHKSHNQDMKIRGRFPSV